MVLTAVQGEAATQLDELPFSAKQREAIRAALQGRPFVPARTDFHEAMVVSLQGSPRKFLVAAAPVPEFLPRATGPSSSSTT